ncbi:MAG: cupredoxin domain-containing protein [Armatimonadota bacterium]|nr:cupredoxin domain-containing protein [Armatimonadota bacterium]MDR7466778.1 cupredoxin domain-containing protein [Armatimonadota bacterium]MDR7492749.1 cupredoxin domain-containing protein [Armatimonadota bacterium]MDR7498525.1 cupredoxin domain-containing protein [Armatimonadota bacterium]MDR7504304.1 cupredoxin domain-containing protein [Armatimonadota bacterium]
MRVKAIFLVGVLTIGGAAADVVAAPAQKLTLTMTEFQYAPRTIALKPGTAVELIVTNKGAVQHEFMLYTSPGSMAMNMDMDKYGAENTYFKDIGVIEVVYPGKKPSTSSRLERVMVDPGQSVTIRFTAKKAGTFEFACHIPGHYEAGMKGTLAVK